MPCAPNGLVVALVLVLAEASLAHPAYATDWSADTPPSEDSQENAAIVWASVTEWLTSIRSATVVSTIIVEASSANRGNARQTIAATAMFDDNLRAFRYQSERKAVQRRRYVRLPDRTIIYEPTGRIVLIEPPTYDLSGAHLDQPIDSRALPFALNSEVFGTCIDILGYIDLCSDEHALSECVLESSGLYRLVCYLGRTKEMRRIVWFDPMRQFVPVGVQLDIHDVKRNIIHRSAYVTKTEWQLAESVYIPVSVEAKTDYGGLSNRTLIEMRWSDINIARSQSDFELVGMDVPVGTSVYDNRLGQQIHSKFGEVAESPPLIDVSKVSEGRQLSKVPLIAINAAAIGIIAGVLWYRRKC